MGLLKKWWHKVTGKKEDALAIPPTSGIQVNTDTGEVNMSKEAEQKAGEIVNKIFGKVVAAQHQGKKMNLLDIFKSAFEEVDKLEKQQQALNSQKNKSLGDGKK